VIRSQTTLRWFVAALCMALLVLRVSGLHLHLCFDGSEPPLSYHLADSGIHHQDEHAAEEPHTDRDVGVADDVLVKKPAYSGDIPFLVFVLTLLLFMIAARRGPGRPNESPARPPRPHPWLRPPLRGPPTPA